jgi:hypothetical protein
MRNRKERARLRELRNQGRARLEQFQRVNAINSALEGEDWLTLNDLLDIDYALIAEMTLDEWQQTVIVRLHDFAQQIGVHYKWQDSQKGKE